MNSEQAQTRSASQAVGPARWLNEFLKLEAAGGLLLMAAAALAMLVANSPLASGYQDLLSLKLRVQLGDAGIAKPLLLWINDGLMAVFFLLVGLELKREVLYGHLSSLKSVGLPAFAAIGGMAFPALIYAWLNWDDPIARRGWAIASATDIAFALGLLSLLGNRVPQSLKAFLLSIAIFDDLGAIVIIAIFYTKQLSGPALGVAAACLLGLAILNRLGVVRLAGYFLLGTVLWVAILKSGVHATLAGVALAVFIPSKLPEFDEQCPLRRLEHNLHPWVAFGILPVFAFANAGVQLTELSPGDFVQPVPLGIAIGLVCGNLIGVTGMSGLAVLLGAASLPKGVRWPHVAGVGMLCGVGFTMSLFIASLAFEHGGAEYPGIERLGILLGSTIAGVLGYVFLKATLPRTHPPV